MGDGNEKERIQTKIVVAVSHVLNIPEVLVKPDFRYWDRISGNIDAQRAFKGMIEASVRIALGDRALSAHPTIADLAAYCARNKGAASEGSVYVVVCRMPDGSTRERYYRASGHQHAAQQAMDDGAARVVSVERDDDEDQRPDDRTARLILQIILPIIIGISVAVAVVYYVLR